MKRDRNNVRGAALIKKTVKNEINQTTKISLHLSLAGIAALCLAQPVCARADKPPHGGGSGGGLPYATVTTVTQLIADINYANSAGGAITINLEPGATFDLTSVNNSIDGGIGLPVIGGTNAANLTIIGNGDTIEWIMVIGKHGTAKNPFGLFDVTAGSSLTLDNVTLHDGSSYSILNRGTLDVIDGSIVSGSAYAVENDGGTVTVSNSALSNNGTGIYNNGGTVTVTGCTLSGNSGAVNNNANGAVTINASTVSGNAVESGNGGGILNNGGTIAIGNGSILAGNIARTGGGIYNNAGIVTISDSTVTNNTALHGDYPWSLGDGGGIYNSGGTLTISGSTISGNFSDLYFGSGGGILNAGTATIENSSRITGNTASEGGDAYNYGTLYLDSTSEIDDIGGSAPIPF